MHVPNKPMNRIWIWVAGIGFALFLWIQVLPHFGGTDESGRQTMNRDAARQAAINVASHQFQLDEDQIRSAMVTYLSHSTAVGYIVKQEVAEAYDKHWEADYPLNVYRVDLTLADGSAALTLYLHAKSGKLVGWQGGSAWQAADRQLVEAERLAEDWQTTDPQATGQQAADQQTAEADHLAEKRQAASQSAAGGTEQAAGDAELAELALQYAAAWSVHANDWIWDGQAMDEAGRWTFLSRQSSGVGQANLLLHVRVPPTYDAASASVPPLWQDGAITYEIRVPDEFSAYLTEQQKLAGKLNALGFVVPQLLLLIMSIIYATTRRTFTSPRRGLALAALFLLMYALFYVNLFPGLRAGLMEDGLRADQEGVYGLFIVNMIIMGLMALFTYLAAVGGDGLWRSMGRNLWPLWREAGFGPALLAGMKRGYVLALLLLGVQSVIILTLRHSIGLFQTSDASQSSYNMTVPWLLLLLAWCAGISEEIQSRLFGIGLFRHWLVDGAARLIGRPLSSRTATWLTAAAMLPPGLFWALGHVGYAVYPVYSRIIELVILALLFGWFMLRFGFLAVMFAHIILNSVLMSMQIWFDGLPGHLAAGLIGPLLPAIVAGLLWRVHRRWIDRRTGQSGAG